MKNKHFKSIVFSFCILFIFFLGTIFIIGIQIHSRYKQEFIHQEQILIGNLLENHPELEEDIIEALLNNQSNEELGKTFFETYGIDLESYDNIHSIFVLKEYTIQKLTVLYGCIILLFAYLLFHNLKKQHTEIKQVTLYLNRILSGDYALEVHEYDEGDISSLKNDIYKITVLLREQEAYSKNEKKYLENVLSDISHQLKTPLTSMYVINDILENDAIDSDKKKEMLSKNKNQLKRIEWLVSSLLKLSRLDSGVVVMQPKKVLVDTLLQQALEPLRIPIELKEQSIEITGDKSTAVEVDLAWTVEAFVNLIKNAHEHTPSKGTIQIRYQDNPIYVEFQIEDNGEGISPIDLPHIFERFYKGSSSNKDSIGIGLNMAKTILQKQNGIITVKSKEQKGTTFTIKFYKNVL